MNFFKYVKYYTLSEDDFIVFCQVSSVFSSFIKSIVLLGFGIGLKSLALVIIGAAALVTLIIMLLLAGLSEGEWTPLAVCFLFCLITNPLIFILVIINVSNNKSFFNNVAEDRKLKIEYENSYNKIRRYYLED